MCESGSSLFGFIEEVIATDYVLNNGENIQRINKLLYLGSDISDMMNRGAKEFHPENQFKFSTADTICKLMDEYKNIGLFYGLSVSLRYALRNASDLIKVAKNSKLVTLNRVSLSYEGDIQVKAGTGKYAYLVSINDVRRLAEQEGIVIRYTTENMQRNKDCDHSVRASVIMSKDIKLIETFMSCYDSYMKKVANEVTISGYRKGEWKEIKDLMEGNE